MGCVSTRESLSKYEHAIILMEDQLEYFKNNCTLVDSIIRKYSDDSMINESQWEDIVLNLEIKVKNTSLCPLAEKFYSRLKTEKGFPRNKMLLLGILLSNGLARQKGRLIFEIYDKDCNYFLTIEEIEKIIDDIANISINILPKLVENSTSPPASRQEIKKYIKRLNEKLYLGKESLKNFIIGDGERIEVMQFSLKFDNDNDGKILTPHGFRSFIDSQEN